MTRRGSHKHNLSHQKCEDYHGICSADHTKGSTNNHMDSRKDNPHSTKRHIQEGAHQGSDRLRIPQRYDAYMSLQRPPQTSAPNVTTIFRTGSSSVQSPPPDKTTAAERRNLHRKPGLILPQYDSKSHNEWNGVQRELMPIGENTLSPVEPQIEKARERSLSSLKEETAKCEALKGTERKVNGTTTRPHLRCSSYCIAR